MMDREIIIKFRQGTLRINGARQQPNILKGKLK